MPHSNGAHSRKIFGLFSANQEMAIANYSMLFKFTFEPLRDTLEQTPFDLNEDESSFVVNRILQVFLYCYYANRNYTYL